MWAARARRSLDHDRLRTLARREVRRIAANISKLPVAPPPLNKNQQQLQQSFTRDMSTSGLGWRLLLAHGEDRGGDFLNHRIVAMVLQHGHHGVVGWIGGVIRISDHVLGVALRSDGPATRNIVIGTPH